MPNTDKSKANIQKKRLGRGLGSLLSTDVNDFGEEDTQNKQVTKEKSPDKEIKKQEKTQTQSQQAPVPEPQTNQDPSGRIWNLPIEKVIPNQTQPRKDFEKEPLEELSQSIKEQGVLQPITVRKVKDKYEIIAGERRWRACQMAGLHGIPAVIKDVDDQRSMELALIENLQREDLNPVEEAMGYQFLIDEYTLSQQDLAKKVGRSRSSITNALRILVLPRDVKQMIRQGLLSLGHAKVLLGLEDHKLQVKLGRKCVQKRLSVRALEQEVKRIQNPSVSAPSELSVREKMAHKLSDELQKVMGTKVKMKYKKGKGQVQISFYNDEELSSICERIKDAWLDH